MAQIWNFELSNLVFSNENRVTRKKPHADFERPPRESDCKLIQPLPIGIIEDLKDAHRFSERD